jgi:hypothetical protein
MIADGYFADDLFVRWQGVNGQYSTGFGYESHVSKQVSPVLTWVCSRSS